MYPDNIRRRSRSPRRRSRSPKIQSPTRDPPPRVYQYPPPLRHPPPQYSGPHQELAIQQWHAYCQIHGYPPRHGPPPPHHRQAPYAPPFMPGAPIQHRHPIPHRHETRKSRSRSRKRSLSRKRSKSPKKERRYDRQSPKLRHENKERNEKIISDAREHLKLLERGDNIKIVVKRPRSKSPEHALIVRKSRKRSMSNTPEPFHKKTKRKVTSSTETYTPVDLSIKASDTAMPIDEIRKVLWEDYDPTEIYGSKFIIPVQGYFCRLCQKFYQSRVAACEKHTRSELHFKNLKKILSLSNGQEEQAKQDRVNQIQKEKIKKRWLAIQKEDEVAARKYEEGVKLPKPVYVGGTQPIKKENIKINLSKFLNADL